MAASQYVPVSVPQAVLSAFLAVPLIAFGVPLVVAAFTFTVVSDTYRSIRNLP